MPNPFVHIELMSADAGKAKSLGGKVHKALVDIGVGAFSIVEDPAGAMIGLWKQKKK